ncbi:MAG: DNA-binding protein [Prevotellaceae bacterium]|nr:DNA-binding protein [Prevotellaceae bacterium]
MAINYSKVLKQVPVGSGTYKVYAQAQTTQIWGLDEFAQHIHDHNSVASKGMILLILTDMVTCLKEKLLDGVKVRLGDFGSFWLSLHSHGEDNADDFTAQDITGITLSFTAGSSMTSDELMKDATFEFVGTRAQQAETRAQRNADLNEQAGGSSSSSQSGSGSQSGAGGEGDD